MQESPLRALLPTTGSWRQSRVPTGIRVQTTVQARGTRRNHDLAASQSAASLPGFPSQVATDHFHASGCPAGHDNYSGKYMLKQPLAEARHHAVCRDHIWRAVDATDASGTRRGSGSRFAARPGLGARAIAESLARSAGCQAQLSLEGRQAAPLLDGGQTFFSTIVKLTQPMDF
jgi:hypothetical protein